MSQGRFIEAKELANAFESSVGTDAEWAPAAKELIASFDTAESKSELALEKSVASILRGMEAKGPKGGEDESLRKLVEGTEAMKVGVRAEKRAAALAKVDAK